MYGEPAVKRVFSTYGPIGPSLKTEIHIEGAFYTGNGIVEYDVKYSKQTKLFRDKSKSVRFFKSTKAFDSMKLILFTDRNNFFVAFKPMNIERFISFI